MGIKSDPLVSVIVRTKDRPQLLSEALSSIQSQTYANIEIVLVNDGGVDVQQLLACMAGERPVTYIRHPSNLGRAMAANSGISAAQGQYLNFLDDDDIFYADHIETLLTFLENTKNMVAYSSVRNVFYEGTMEAIGNRIKEEVIFNHTFDSDRLLFENYIPLMAVMFSRSVLEKVPGFDEQLGVFEDWDFWMRLSRFYSFVHLDHVTAEYRFYGGNGVENSHRQKYGYDQALGLMFERALPYLNAKAWLNFLNNGLVGRLKQQESSAMEALHRLRDDYAQCLELVRSLHSDIDAWHRDYHILESRLEEVHRSISWRITSPLRWISKCYHRIKIINK